MVDTVHGTFPGDFCRVSKSKIRGPKVEIKPRLNRIHMCLQPGGSPPRDGVVRANSAVKDRVAGLENWGHSGDCTPAQPVIPKNISSGVQIVVTQNGQTLTPAAIAQYLGEPFQVVGEFSGPGLTQTVEVPPTPPGANSLI